MALASGLLCHNATPIAVSGWCPETGVPYEPMFDSKTTFTGRLTDAVDLMIDFATLGEYGLEPVGRTTPSCEARHRPAPPLGPVERRRAAESKGMVR